MPDAQGRPLRADMEDVKPTLFSNVTYDVLNNIVTIVFPAAVALYAGLAVLWGWENAEKVVASAGLVITFLGILVKVASNRYQKVLNAEAAAGIPRGGFEGEIVINTTDPMKDTVRLNMPTVDFQDLAAKNKVTLEVVREDGVSRENHGL